MEKMMTRSCPPCLVRCFQIKIKFLGKKRKQRLLQARKKNFKKASTMIKSVYNVIPSFRIDSNK